MWDVFLLDSDFKIERPKRYYRQGLNILHSDTKNDENIEKSDNQAMLKLPRHSHDERKSIIGSVRSRISKIFSLHHQPASDPMGENLDTLTARSTESTTSVASQEPTPMLDPSTNANPLVVDPDKENETEEKKKQRSADVSKHTFYIVNSQMRLKLFARNEVSTGGS